MNLADSLVDELEGTREWMLKLLADLKGEDWFFQPAAGLAHPLWIIGHLTCSQDALVHVRCLGAGRLPATYTSRFPIGGPVPSAREHAYPPLDEVWGRMNEIHAATCTAVRKLSDEFLRQPAFAADGKSPHPHYRDKRGAIIHVSRHEAFHAGQLALIRRLLGKPFLR